MYEDYCSVVKTPMDISTVMERIRSDYYLNKRQRPFDMFYRDVIMIF